MNTFRTLAAAASLLLASATFAGEKEVTFHGKVVTLDGGTRKTTVIIQRAGQQADTTEVGFGGLFSMNLGENEHALITFTQNGYVTKVVDINTTNCISKFSKDDSRKVRFDVELLPQNEDKNLAFVAPVGHVTFAKGGLLKVSYDHNLVTLPVQENEVASK
ncbi:MAG: hypothetical protein JST41_05655 [Bacteroidetes bacterium]|jgi:hypothetical protein|nr:hypothetical protein [Bacteroidota bacterium]MBX7129471.1 hypothetical protein [Flavobacteriales bacterium]MCC6656402.1 hypothetical protein [Flavobacteriales bacterium]HMW97572.1 hypothetical protein [Flavobacteriales bacterium]HNE80803.1 hypothetical protein [Flavobacteriales bacterium]